jgi:hypothetical protein
MGEGGTRTARPSDFIGAFQQRAADNTTETSSDARCSIMAMRDITELMNTYRECSRNLWNVYFSGRHDSGNALDTFEQIRELLFDSIVLNELSYEGEAEGKDIPPPALKVVPTKSLILIKRLTPPGQGGYWDEVKDMVVGPDDVRLAFVDYFDFSQVPIKEFRYCLCEIVSFPSHVEYEGREALVEALNTKVFHDEPADQN